MRTFHLNRRLSHADVDFLGELKTAALLGLLEQAAVEASSEAGFDAAWYTRAGRIWIIRRTRLERHLPVGGCDTVDVETAIADFRRARSLRRYSVRRDGVAVAEATTDWVYCDLTSGRPMRIPDDMQRTFGNGEQAPTLDRADALPAEGEGAAVEFALTVHPSHLDHVAHVNNAVYTNYLEDAAFALFAAHGWPLERMLAARGALRVRRLDCEYLNDALAGEALLVRSWLIEGDEALRDDAPPHAVRVRQAITRASGATIIRAESDWVWRRKPEIVGGVPPP